MPDYKMNADQAVKFCKLYKKKDCLWNKDSPLYKDRYARRKAMQEIAREMDIDGFGSGEVAQKIKNIRWSYYRMLKNISNGILPKVAWFPIVDSFLRGSSPSSDAIQQRGGSQNSDASSSNSDDDPKQDDGQNSGASSNSDDGQNSGASSNSDDSETERRSRSTSPVIFIPPPPPPSPSTGSNDSIPPPKPQRKSRKTAPPPPPPPPLPSAKLCRKYLSAYDNDHKKVDTLYGIRRNRFGDYMIGDSKVEIENDTGNLIIDSVVYQPSIGLWELLTRRIVDLRLLTWNDLQTYKDILIQTGGHLNKRKKIKAKKSPKYRKIVSKLFPPEKEAIPWIPYNQDE